MKRIGRPLRLLCLLVGGWIGLCLAVNAVFIVAGLVLRWTGHDPRVDDSRWPDIKNLRVVDDRLLVGAQPSSDEYRELADRGVRLVIDMRTGGVSDKSTDDPQQLAQWGLGYARLPIPDGHAPAPTQIRRFLDLVAGADGLVLAHCGGGVGRSTSVAAAYEAAHEQDPSVLEQLATGPPTIEQVWFVATLRPNHPAHHVDPALALVSRVVDVPRNVYGWITARL